MPKGMRGQAKKHRFGAKEKVTGGVLKRATARAEKLGMKGKLKGGVTGAEARGLLKAAGKRKPSYIGRSFINRVQTGPGSQRKGQEGQVAYRGGKFIHEYKSGKRVTLSADVAKQYGYKKPQGMRTQRRRRARPNAGRSRQSGGARYTS